MTDHKIIDSVECRPYGNEICNKPGIPKCLRFLPALVLRLREDIGISRDGTGGLSETINHIKQGLFAGGGFGINFVIICPKQPEQVIGDYRTQAMRYHDDPVRFAPVIQLMKFFQKSDALLPDIIPLCDVIRFRRKVTGDITQRIEEGAFNKGGNGADNEGHYTTTKERDEDFKVVGLLAYWHRSLVCLIPCSCGGSLNLSSPPLNWLLSFKIYIRI